MEERDLQIVDVLIPKEIGYMGIAGGSGIVSVQKGDFKKVYYEGNLFAAVNMHEAKERVMIAASRALTNSPTVAFMGCTEDKINEHFEKVGIYSYETDTLVIDPDCRDKWEQWIALYHKAA